VRASGQLMGSGSSEGGGGGEGCAGGKGLSDGRGLPGGGAVERKLANRFTFPRYRRGKAQSTPR
jgi:hypothetical protein